jgi:long-chain fatty acid transport protein
MNWKDSWFFALGAEYALDDRWTLKGGTALDKTPVPTSTKGPRIADNNRTWLALGARYHMSDSFDVSLSYAHLFYPDSKIDLHQTDPGSALRGNLSGVTESSTNIFAAQLDFHTR